MQLLEKLDNIYKNKRFNLIAFGLIAVMILLAYSNTFTASFHFDDNPQIVENPFIKRVTIDNIMKLLNDPRPIVSLTLMLNYQLSGLNVVGWHIFNIVVHIANSMMVYFLMLHALRSPRLIKSYDSKASRMSLFCALLFAVHPIQTESVTYLISRSELVATFFYLSTFLLFIDGVEKKKFGYFIAASFTAFLAVGSKEWAVTLPATLMLYDFLFVSNSDLKKVVGNWKAYGLVMLSWIYIFMRVDLAPGGNASFGFSVSTTSGITPWTYLLTSCNVLWTYIRLLILPINQNIDYDYAIAKTFFEFPTILSVLGHMAVIIISIWSYRKKGWIVLPFGAAWFYITFSPTQSFVPIIDVIFEHRAYLPSIGFFITFVAAYETFFDWIEKRRLVTGPVGKGLKKQA